jgi:alcohol dehydrogenase, propanol-preferring
MEEKTRMSRTMMAYRLLDWQQPPQLVETEIPQPGHGEVRVKVAGNGLCHSDVIMPYIPREIAEPQGWRMPFTLGHEIGGHIDLLGEGVRHFSVGDPVVLISPHSCGTCWYCLRGLDSACTESGAGRGYGRDGGLAPFVVATAAREVIKLRTLDPKRAAPITDAGTTSYHAVKRALPRLMPGSTAVVIGAGGLGSFAVQYLRVLSPAKVIAVDLNPARLAFARELGAHEVLTGVSGSTAQDIRALTGGEGAHAVLDFVGNDASIEAGVAALRKAGVFALVGAGGGTLQQPWGRALPHEAEIFTHQGGTISDTQEAIALADAGLIRSEIDVFPMSRVAEAYEQLDRGELRGRAVVTPES